MDFWAYIIQRLIHNLYQENRSIITNMLDSFNILSLIMAITIFMCWPRLPPLAVGGNIWEFVPRNQDAGCWMLDAGGEKKERNE